MVMETVLEAFNASDQEKTTVFQDELMCRGRTEGQLAFGLFRAQKRSSRAKEYRRRSHKQNSYAGKAEALKYVDAVLSSWGDELDVNWGWRVDPRQAFHKHVLYVDFGSGYQCSFHSEVRYSEREFDGKWDSSSSSTRTVLEYCDQVVQQNAVCRWTGIG